MPDGADAVILQENTEEATARGARVVVVRDGTVEPEHVRPAGMDFRTGDALLPAGRRLGPAEVSLAAAMGHGAIAVRRRPRVAVLSTGDELVVPGARPGLGQIIASNQLAIAAIAAAAGAEVRHLGIARDTRQSLADHIARAAGADVLVTIGGASVGDHDLVGPALAEHGMALAFWKIAMRPGKPLMFGRLGPTRVLGLPGNPASAMVCARLFLVPLLWALLGRPVEACVSPIAARLSVGVGPNGAREHYMRAVSSPGDDGVLRVDTLPDQHSSLIAPLAAADCLVIRPPHADALAAGSIVPILRLET
jgi:molybdopterin molybdotransferase